MFDDSESTPEVLRDVMTALLSGVCVSSPGLVTSASGDTASVIPMINRRDSEGNPRPYSELRNVTVIWPGGGGWAVKSELKAGDIVWVVFADGPLDEWREKLSVVTPESNRSHALSDGVAFPTSLGTSTGGTLTIQNAAGIGIEFTATKITLSGNVDVTGLLAAGTAVPGAGVTLNTHTHPVVDGVATAPNPGT
jgi:hypothetical protein